MNLENIEDTYPLSPIQQGMLFHSQYAPQSGVYVQQLVCELRGPLKMPDFRQAWQRVTKRHAVLRTSFRLHGEDPIQEVHSHVLIPWEEHDWRGLAQSKQEDRLEAYLEMDRARGFDLAEAPLMRIAFFRMAETDYRMIWTSHHALLDGRSRLLVLKELFTFYQAICQGQDLQLVQPRPYRDYIDWLGKQDWTETESYWRQMLGGFSSPTPLTVNRPYPCLNEKRLGRQERTLTRKLTSALRSLAAQHQLTVNTLLQGAWALLLSRYSGQEDIVYGAIRSGRHTTVEGAQAMVGLLINTVPVRVRVAADMALLPWLKRIRQHWIAVREYEHAPLIQVQGWSNLVGGKPLFESVVGFENYRLDDALQAQGGTREKRRFRLIGATNYPLVLSGYLGTEILLEIVYDRRRFDDLTITRMLGHVHTLLDNMATHPERRVSELRVLTGEESRQLVEWNETKRDYPERCIHQLFEAQVERTPDAPAVVFEDQTRTYGELNQRANQLAHSLRALGVKPDVLVGVYMERSVEMITALLGILKAGGAYLPLDPGHPTDRLAFMLEEARATVLLTQSQLAPELFHQGTKLIRLDEEWETISAADTTNPDSGATADNLAYVMYTSGSTGKPKGVAVAHRGVVRLIKGQDYVTLNSGSAVLQFAPISFDASTFEIWGCLLNSGRLALMPGRLPSLEELGRMLKRHRIDTLWLTAALFQAMVDNHLDDLRGIRQLLSGGDVLSVPHVKRFLKAVPGCRFVDAYGPTENTTFTSCYPVTCVDEIVHSVPVGRPIANTQLYILDCRLDPVPIGVPGELYTGGDGLARGYLSSPGLTAEKFLPNPFSRDPGARLYKTGDLARYLPDGNVEFLGRIDQQVKIRGFRVEPGEIEAVLAEHASVRQAVVKVQEESGEKRLVAYIVPRLACSVDAVELRGFLKQKLPNYMVPSAFVSLDELPLSPNGKIDRQNLPAPLPSKPEEGVTFVPPHSNIEEALSKIWATVLRLEQVGIHDNFFELGGHSLLAAQVVSRVRKAINVELPLGVIFDTPTVAGLARTIEEAKRQGIQVRTPPVTPRSQRLQQAKLA